ncbi:MAG: O-antigen ligase family protein [Pseudomonadota bacterium]
MSDVGNVHQGYLVRPPSGQTARQPLGMATLARAALILIPALIMLDPILIWPLLYADPGGSTDVLAGAGRGFSASLLRMVWFPPIFLGTAVLFLLATRSLAPLARGPLLWWVFFFAWCMLSVVWALETGISASRLMLALIMMGSLVLAFAASNNRRTILVLVFWVFVAGVLANTAAVLTRPPGPIGHEGIFDHKNMLGAFAAAATLLACLMFTVAGRLTKVAAAVSIALCLVVLSASESKASTGFLPLAFGFGIVAALLARYGRINPAVSAVLAIAATGVLIASAEAIFAVNPRYLAEIATGDATFTGRTFLWEFAWEYVRERPLLGYGFRSFWDIGPETPSLREGFGFIATTFHGHNGYLDLLLSVGLIGLVLFLPILWVGLSAAGRIARARFWEGSMLIAIMMFAMLHNFMETSFFFGPHTILIFNIVWLYAVFDDVNAGASLTDPVSTAAQIRR